MLGEIGSGLLAWLLSLSSKNHREGIISINNFSVVCKESNRIFSTECVTFILQTFFTDCFTVRPQKT